MIPAGQGTGDKRPGLLASLMAARPAGVPGRRPGVRSRRSGVRRPGLPRPAVRPDGADRPACATATTSGGLKAGRPDPGRVRRVAPGRGTGTRRWRLPVPGCGFGRPARRVPPAPGRMGPGRGAGHRQAGSRRRRRRSRRPGRPHARSASARCGRTRARSCATTTTGAGKDSAAPTWPSSSPATSSPLTARARGPDRAARPAAAGSAVRPAVQARRQHDEDQAGHDRVHGPAGWPPAGALAARPQRAGLAGRLPGPYRQDPAPGRAADLRPPQGHRAGRGRRLGQRVPPRHLAAAPPGHRLPGRAPCSSRRSASRG